MKKIVLIVITIFLCSFNYYPNGVLASDSDTDIVKDLAVLEKINTEVSQLFKVDGKGVPTRDGYKKVIASKEANCTQYAYVFARRAFIAGYQVKILGVTTSRNTNHAVVNVKVRDKWFLFDPTNGIYYKADAFDIFQEPELVKEMVGTEPTKSTKVYTKKSFFQEIGKITIAENLDYAEHDLSIEAKIIEKSKFYKTPNDIDAAIYTESDKDYTAAVNGEFPNYFVLKWDVPHEFYRVSLQWVDQLNYATDFQILALVEGKYVSVLEEKNYKTDDLHYVKLLKPIKTNQLKFLVNKTAGQERLLLRRFSVYE